MFQPRLKNIGQNGNLPQVGLKIGNIWKHHLVLFRPFIRDIKFISCITIPRAHPCAWLFGWLVTGWLPVYRRLAFFFTRSIRALILVCRFDGISFDRFFFAIIMISSKVTNTDLKEKTRERNEETWKKNLRKSLEIRVLWVWMVGWTWRQCFSCFFSIISSCLIFDVFSISF